MSIRLDHGTIQASFDKLRPVLSTVRSFESLRTNGVEGTNGFYRSW
jgi:hypothetical protein